jgi:Protein phosphatase 2C
VSTTERPIVAAPGWQVAAASVIGSMHRREGSPAQDSFTTWAESGHAVVAVADGHGHFQHFRSAVGSALAVKIAQDLLVSRVRRFEDAESVAAELRDRVGPALVEAWIAACLTHARQHPFTGAEPDVGRSEQQLLLPYGSTVIAMAASPRVLAVLQLGDGDAVVASRDGRVWRPLPEDADLDGVRTTSLCQPDPLRSLRSTAIAIAHDDPVLGFVSTDGFGSPREDAETWWVQVGQELVDHLRLHGHAWVSSRLQGWLEEPAELGGDDTTLGVLSRP